MAESPRQGHGRGRLAESDRPAGEPGILHPSDAMQHFDHQRHSPDERLSPFVLNLWTVVWDLRDRDPFTAQVLPYPSVNLSVTNTEADVTGVTRRRYNRHLAGRGYVVGARFRPGCFRPFLNGPVAGLTDQHRPISEVLGRATDVLQRAVAATSDRDEWVELLTSFLLQDLPPRDPRAEDIALLVDEIAARTDLVRVEQVAELAQVGVRRLQRLFADYVGAAPKWVIMRCRLQDAAARAGSDDVQDWAALAVELGFSDQAHLTRAFSQTIGTPPAAYAARAKFGGT